MGIEFRAPALTSAAIIAALGYTPVNRAGDTLTGTLLANATTVNLGSGASPFGDSFLKSGGKLDFGNGNATITHSSGQFTLVGNLITSAAIKSYNQLSGVGYNLGAGGSVTQDTSKATGVTLNRVCGQITMASDALGAGAKVSFVHTNSAVAATDSVIVCLASGGTANAYRVAVTAIAAGSYTITVENITGGSLSEAPVITFAVIKSVSS